MIKVNSYSLQIEFYFLSCSCYVSWLLQHCFQQGQLLKSRKTATSQFDRTKNSTSTELNWMQTTQQFSQIIFNHFYQELNPKKRESEMSVIIPCVAGETVYTIQQV